MSTTDTQRKLQQEGHRSMEAEEKERKEEGNETGEVGGLDQCEPFETVEYAKNQEK